MVPLTDMTVRNENVRPRNIYGCVFLLSEKTQMHIHAGTHNATDNFHWGTSGWYMYSSLTHTHTTLAQLIFAKLLVSLMTIYWVLQYYMYLVEHP